MRSGKYVIMHVDDSLTARELVREVMEEAGFEVREAESASDMEIRLSRNPGLREVVDLFILDMEMPDLTGAQLGAVIQEVYQELTRVPFIIYTGKEREWVESKIEEVAEISEAFRKNYRGCLTKVPGSEEQLVDMVKKVLESAGKK